MQGIFENSIQAKSLQNAAEETISFMSTTIVPLLFQAFYLFREGLKDYQLVKNEVRDNS